MEEFDEKRNVARVLAGMKGGPFYKNPVLAPARTFVDGTPMEVDQKLNAPSSIPAIPIMDSWNERQKK
jgi:hypothetical protein